MKKNLSTLILLLSIVSLYGQITLQKTYNYSTAVAKLETLGYKYYLMDVPANQVRIYNLDHSVYKTINCNVPNGYFLSDIKYVSQNLFNSDTQIEFVYSYYKYVPTSTSYYYIYGAKVINESGSNLLSIEGAQYIFVNKTGETEYKLFAYCYDYSVSPEKVWTNIYNLSGSLVSAMNISGNNPDNFVSAYPNPATDIIRVDYVLPDDIKSARLNILDSNGKTVKNFLVDGHSDHLALNVNDLSSGIYHYYIEYDNRRTSAKKIVIN
jgi:hypothetical protein